MRFLSDPDIIKIWEVGQKQHPLDRALTCLSFAYPERSLMSLANLTLGERDAALLMLREQTFGSKLESVATCPHCREQLEFVLSTHDMCVIDLPAMLTRQPSPSDDDYIQTQYTFNFQGIVVQFRLPNSLDLADVIKQGQANRFKFDLAQRCLLSAYRNEQALSVEEIEQDAIAAFGNHLAQADPQAEILLDLNCPACQQEWQMRFEIVSYLWTEISNYAKRLLVDVHQLAKAYGWGEREILMMSKYRRKYYLDLVI